MRRRRGCDGEVREGYGIRSRPIVIRVRPDSPVGVGGGDRGGRPKAGDQVQAQSDQAVTVRCLRRAWTLCSLR
jgi:hypothetical protein